MQNIHYTFASTYQPLTNQPRFEILALISDSQFHSFPFFALFKYIYMRRAIRNKTQLFNVPYNRQIFVRPSFLFPNCYMHTS